MVDLAVVVMGLLAEVPWSTGRCSLKRGCVPPQWKYAEIRNLCDESARTSVDVQMDSSRCRPGLWWMARIMPMCFLTDGWPSVRKCWNARGVRNPSRAREPEGTGSTITSFFHKNVLLNHLPKCTTTLRWTDMEYGHRNRPKIIVNRVLL